MDYHAIWKDYIVDLQSYLGTAGYVDYTVTSGTETIYTGRAYKDAAGGCKVRLNELCADFLSNPVHFESEGWSGTNLGRAFALVVGTATAAEVTFVLDWSYDYGRAGRSADTNPASEPIDGKIDPRQWFVFSTYEGGVLTCRIRHSRGDFGSDFNDDFTVGAYERYISGEFEDVYGNWMFEPGEFVPGDDVQMRGEGEDWVNYTVVEPCTRYALYYRNAFGGWDSFLVGGNAKQTDGYERTTMRLDYDNGTRTARGRRDIVNAVTRNFTLVTGWLTDAQAARMHHLLGSVEVYLDDLTDGDTAPMPVVLTNSECEHKTYKGNGNALVNYTIMAELAQDMQRR